MSKIVFDADGLIKLARAGIVDLIKQDCIISQEVFEEAVTEGKKRMYEDAFEIERLVKQRKIRVVKTSNIKEIPGLGTGELSALALYLQTKSKAIVSDDRRFLDILAEEGIPFIIPTEVIVALALNKTISRKQGLNALLRIKEFVSKDNYESALQALGGKQ